jgi:hypothetical protein
MNSNSILPVIIAIAGIALCIFLIKKIAKGKSSHPITPQKNKRTFLEMVAFCGLLGSPMLIIYGFVIFSSGNSTSQDHSNGETFIVLSFLIGLVSLITLIVLAIKNHWQNKIK